MGVEIRDGVYAPVLDLFKGMSGGIRVLRLVYAVGLLVGRVRFVGGFFCFGRGGERGERWGVWSFGM